MKVYGYPQSTCTQKVILTLAEKHASFDFEVVDLQNKEQKEPEHLSRQPFGVVPVLDDNGFILYESHAIVHYLDNILPGIDLTPHEDHEIGRMEQWMSVVQSYFSAPALTLVKQLYWGPKQGKIADPELAESSESQVEYVLHVLEKELSNKPYLSGNHFSLAEVCWIPYFNCLNLAQLEHLIIVYPAVHGWWIRISKRPSWVKVLGQT